MRYRRDVALNPITLYEVHAISFMFEMKLRNIPPLVILTMASTFYQCASTPSNTGFTQSGLNFQNGTYLDKVYKNENSVLTRQNMPIRIDSINIDFIHDYPNVSAKYCRNTLEAELVKFFEFSSTQASPKLTAEFAITYLDPGDAAARIVAGELGAGHAWIQIEGVVRQKDEIIFAFIDRKRNSGKAGLSDLAGPADKKLVTFMIQEISQLLIKEING